MESSKKVTFIKDWISDYVNSMPKKAESLVIGISGGIDSSVSSTLSAMTGLKTIVLSMPIKQKSAQHDLSLKHQEWLKQNFKNVEGITVELDSLFSTFESTLKDFYRVLKKNNINEEEIEKIFNTPVKMKLFSWNKEVDTILSPMDSIKYYKYYL